MTTDRALYEKMYAAQLAEGHDLETAMRFNKASTPEDFLRAFGESSDPRHQHRKWGGGNKMGSGGAAVNAARRARAEARRSAPDANVNNYTNKNLADRLGLTALSNFVDSRVNDVQGKFMPSQPSFGFSQKTLNEAGARGADSSFAGDIGGSVYGGDMSSIGGIDGSLIAGDPNRGLNRGRDYGVGDSKEGSYGYTTDSDFGKRMRDAVLGMPIQASVPRMAGLFIT
tara:strand:+ start:2391 stop:3071 length:681 start_codon:yes stop_codon:yes gene_type:complete